MDDEAISNSLNYMKARLLRFTDGRADTPVWASARSQ